MATASTALILRLLAKLSHLLLLLRDELANQESIVPPSTTLRAPTGDADQAIFDAEGWDF